MMYKHLYWVTYTEKCFRKIKKNKVQFLRILQSTNIRNNGLLHKKWFSS